MWELRELPVLTALTSLTLMTVDRSSSLAGPWLAPSQHKLNEGLLLPFRLSLHWAVICETVSVFLLLHGLYEFSPKGDISPTLILAFFGINDSVNPVV